MDAARAALETVSTRARGTRHVAPVDLESLRVLLFATVPGVTSTDACTVNLGSASGSVGDSIRNSTLFGPLRTSLPGFQPWDFTVPSPLATEYPDEVKADEVGAFERIVLVVQVDPAFRRCVAPTDRE